MRRKHMYQTKLRRYVFVTAILSAKSPTLKRQPVIACFKNFLNSIMLTTNAAKTHVPNKIAHICICHCAFIRKESSKQSKLTQLRLLSCKSISKYTWNVINTHIIQRANSFVFYLHTKLKIYNFTIMYLRKMKFFHMNICTKPML